MNQFRSTYAIVFSGFLCSVILVFFYLRPMDSQWDRIINGDGLGYYAYLPANYIYQDKAYEFKWFNTVYKAHYAPGTFSNPEDNLLVNYGDRKINKYYQGLSFLWLPFFAGGHLYAKLAGFPADGFSLPYQVAIAIASLSYLLLGLVFLRKLLYKLFKDFLISTVVPIALFYGSYLFNYGIYYNSLSHVYSFTCCVLFIYFLLSYFNETQNRSRNALLCALCLVISVCIRPLNGLILFFIPAFLPQGFFKQKFSFQKITPGTLIILFLMMAALIWQLTITRKQTGVFFPDTYTGETFHMERSVFFDALFSYRLGLFVYSPLMLLSFLGAFYLPLRKGLVLCVLFFGILFLYSAWWYWPIVKRAMVDFYVIPAIFMGALFHKLHAQRVRIALFGFACLALVFFQFKNYQLRRGILDEFYTYKEVFWRNFFRTQHTNMFLVEPSAILKQKTEVETFESPAFAGNRSSEEMHEGKFALALDQKNYISQIASYSFPAFFSETGSKKIRFSFWIYCSEEIRQVHFFLKFSDKQNQLIKEVPFYLNEESLFAATWDYKEFGIELADQPELSAGNVGEISLAVWNVDAKGKLYIDDVKTEFLLTDPARETFK